MRPDWTTDSLPGLAATIWSELDRSAGDPTHPWRTPGLATLDASGPQVRTVVLRATDLAQRQLVAFSDARATKVSQLIGEQRAQWLFHDSAQRLQLRATTTVQVHQADDVVRRYWESVPESNRRNYRSLQSPGAVLSRPEEGRARLPDSAAAQFAVLCATVTELDWLWLADTGHRHARFRWQNEAWQGDWLVP